MFHFFARTEPPKQRKPLHRLVQHGYSLTWFKYIFACLRPTEHENLKLRPLCQVFAKALKPPCWTSFPHPEYSTLTALFARFDALKAPALLPALLLIKNGTHNEGGNIVGIKRSMSIVGESRERCIVLGGLKMKGKKGDDVNVNVSNLTLRESKGYGVYGNRGASIHLDNVSVENSEWHGVVVYGTERNTMKNCNVSYSKWSGLYVGDGLMTISGEDTTIQHNCTDGNNRCYGLDTHNSTIHLVSPLTIEAISTDNGGGGNVGGQGTIVLIAV